jgi:hypothetical protein
MNKARKKPKPEHTRQIFVSKGQMDVKRGIMVLKWGQIGVKEVSKFGRM